MAITTYSELKTSVAAWLHRDNLTTYIPDFIALGEAKINDELMIRDMETRFTVALATNTRYVSLPTRFKQMRRLHLNTDPLSRIEFVSPALMHQKICTGTGKPSWYSINGNDLELNITPDVAYEIEMMYRKGVEPLSGTVASNSVLDNYPNVYLYASLIAAEPFLENDARTATWAQLYSDAVASANRSHSHGKYTSGTLRAQG